MAEILFNLARTEEKRLLIDHINNQRGYKWVSIHSATRSTALNAYYFAVVVKMIADHTGHTTKEIHAVLAFMFVPEMKRTFNKGEWFAPGQTKHMTQERFLDYIIQCQAWAADFLNLFIPDPTTISAID